MPSHSARRRFGGHLGSRIGAGIGAGLGIAALALACLGARPAAAEQEIRFTSDLVVNNAPQMATGDTLYIPPLSDIRLETEASAQGGALFWNGSVFGQLASPTDPVARLGSEYSFDASNVGVDANSSNFYTQDIGFKQRWRASSMNGATASGQLLISFDASLSISFADWAPGADVAAGFNLAVPAAGIFRTGFANLREDGSTDALGGIEVTAFHDADPFFAASYGLDSLASPLPVSVPVGEFDVEADLFSSNGYFGGSLGDTLASALSGVQAARTLTLTFIPDEGSSFVPILVPEPSTGLLVALGGAAALALRRLARRR